MSERITISAEQCRFLSAGFNVKMQSGRVLYFRHWWHNSPVFVNGENQPITLDDSCTIQVNAKDYEETCIARIKEMLPSACKLTKFSNGKVAVDDQKNGIMFISCDPWPNEKVYEKEC